MSALLTPPEAALHLAVSVATLADWRCKGEGPPLIFQQSFGWSSEVPRYRPQIE